MYLLDRSVFRHLTLAFVLVTLAAPAACRQVVVPAAAPTRAEMAELWIEPSPNRDLFVGVGGRALSPRPDALFKVTEVKTSGFSEGLHRRRSAGPRVEREVPA